jgi:ATP-dependent RNA helicase DeaD
MNTFEKLGISTELTLALAERGITVPTPVQKEVIPQILEKKDLFFRSETGTGKTLCYLLPAFMRLSSESAAGSPRMLIIAPTHELASQIKGEAVNLASSSGLAIKASLCIGGAPLKRQIEMLKEKPAILAGGPARILELIRLKKLHVRDVQIVALDETDRMLAPEMRDILGDLLSVLPATAQYLASSATLSKYHATLLEKMIPPLEPGTTRRIKIVELPPEDVLKRNIAHWAFYSEGRDKIETLRRFILSENPGKALVFTAIAGQVENIAAQLVYKKIPCSALYAKLDKIERKKAMDDFRAGRSKVLVTSDLAARGLDIPGITHVIQLDVNENEDFFIHRAGRTARAGRSGINAIFGDERELRALSRIEKKLGIIIYPKILHGGKVHTPAQETDNEEVSSTPQ